MRGSHSAALSLGALVAMLSIGSQSRAEEARPHFTFDGAVSREVLAAYLFRSATVMNMMGAEGRDDQLRMALNTGLKFAGRAFNTWGAEAYHVDVLSRLAPRVALAHALDPEMILQGTLFEIITTSVNDVAIPAWVFEEFGAPAERRNFRYEAMLFPDGRMVNHWSPGQSVPDVTRLETRMWMYFLCRGMIDAGFEAIHVGQIELMGQTDTGHAAWAEVLNRLRAYAKHAARRHLVLFDGHVPSHGYTYDGDKLLLDFHSFPLRPAQVPEEPQTATLEMGHLDTLFGRSKGGVTPSGWRCESLPYLVEVDNWGASGREGQLIGDYWVWGYDEMCWFAHQPEAYRNEWLAYAVEWLRQNDPNGFLEMPLARCLAVPVDGDAWYYGNTRAPGMERGFSVEETVKRLWGHVAYDCRDAFLALPDSSRGFAFSGVRLEASGSLALVAQADGAAPTIRWTAPEGGSYAVAGTVGPAEGAWTLRISDDAGAELARIAGGVDQRAFRAGAGLVAGESVRLSLEADDDMPPVPVMLVVSRLGG